MIAVLAVLAVLEGRSPDATPGWGKRVMTGIGWGVKNIAGLVVIGTFIFIVVGLLDRHIDPMTVPSALVEKYRQQQERTSVVNEHVALGNDFLNVDQVEAARQEFNGALKLDASSSAASLGLLKTQLQSVVRGDAEPAVYERRLQHLHVAYPKDSQVAAYYGSALLVNNRLNEADAAFDSALKLDAHSAIAVNGKGNAEDLRNHPDEALALYLQATNMSPNTQEFVNNAAYQLFRLGHYDEAINTYERLVDLDDRFLLPYYILSQAQRLKGALPDAERTQHTLLRLLADRRVPLSAHNSRLWFFHTQPPGAQPKPVYLTTLDDKRCYARLSLALTDRVAGRRRSARAEILRAQRIGLAPEHLHRVRQILRFEAHSLAARQPRWKTRVDEFNREVERRLA